MPQQKYKITIHAEFVVGSPPGYTTPSEILECFITGRRELDQEGSYTFDEFIRDNATVTVVKPKKRKRKVTCNHEYIDADNEGFYGFEFCRFCGKRRHK